MKHFKTEMHFIFSGNGFFDQPRVTVQQVKSGVHDKLFKKFEEGGWPVTLHCDLGCDNYDLIPMTQPISKGCYVPVKEMNLAKKNFEFYKEMLGPHYAGFFDPILNEPNKNNFKKIQHLHVSFCS